MKIYGLIYHDNGKIYNFKSDKDFKKDDYVVVDSDKGIQLAKVRYIKDRVDEDIDEVKPILRKADDKDYDTYLDNLKESDKIMKKVKELVKKMTLDMRILSVSYTLDKQVLLINFVSDDRVDFRDLAKKLANMYKTRIELHQVGARDKAKEVCGIGKCGQKLCCGAFLNRFNPVSMNMAKNQNLALNPTKINGACGRLLCCLSYEDEVYTELAKGLPRVGQKVMYNNTKCNVVNVDILKRTYIVEYDNERIEVSCNE